MTHTSSKREYRPGFDNLERKQLLSAAVPADAEVAHLQITAPAWVQPAPEHIRPYGTGKGIIIITS